MYCKLQPLERIYETSYNLIDSWTQALVSTMCWITTLALPNGCEVPSSITSHARVLLVRDYWTIMFRQKLKKHKTYHMSFDLTFVLHWLPGILPCSVRDEPVIMHHISHFNFLCILYPLNTFWKYPIWQNQKAVEAKEDRALCARQNDG